MKFNSIKFKATAFIFVLGAITILIFSYFSFTNIKKYIKHTYDNEAEQVQKYTTLSFMNEFNNAENLLDLISQNNDIKTIEAFKDGDKLDAQLEQLLCMVPHSKSIQIATEDGDLFVAPKIQIPSSYDAKKRNWYNLAKSHVAEIVWTEPYLDYFNQNIVITAATTLSDSSGKIVGVASIDFEASSISTLIGSSSIGTKGFVMLLNKNGTIIANKDNYMIGEHPLDDNLISSGNSNHEFARKIKNEWYFIKLNVINDKNTMFLLTGISMKELETNLFKAYLPILVSGILTLIIFNIIAYFSVMRLIKPIERLSKLMEAAEKGNYNVNAIVNGYDEIHSLSESFNRMITSIRKRDEEITMSNKELSATEEKLRQKYAELQDSQKTLKISQQKIKRLAYYDSLTGLSNRARLIKKLEAALEDPEALRTGGAVMYIDLDNFKTINDTLGHSVGDKVLIEIAKRFNEIQDHKKIVARIGGDEFIMMLSGSNVVNNIIELTSNLSASLQKPITIDSKSFDMTASIGVALYPKHGASVEDLLKKADMAMYKAKEKGKHCFQIFDESMEVELITKVNLENGIRQALLSNEFTLHFQPQYNIKEGKILGLEALIRWNSPTLGQVSPFKFIKVAEQTGLIIALDKWVLRNACIFAKKINEVSSNIIKVSINISAVHIMQNNFINDVMEIINETGVKKEYIGFEITETTMMESFNSNKKKLEEVNKLGIEIHLDDFGSGYSSLNYLQNLPINYVKIDKAFIDTILNSEKDGRITEAIVDLAHNIGLKVIAEGVETKEQFDLLTRFDCDFIQGYYMSRPLPQKDIEELLGT